MADSSLPILSQASIPTSAAEKSVFDVRPIRSFYDEVREIYLADGRPWVIGYSGGKDSTATLQLVWLAIAELPADQRTKPVFVISSDTFVETPIIVNHREGPALSNHPSSGGVRCEHGSRHRRMLAAGHKRR